MSRRNVIIIVIAIAVLAVGAIVGWYAYEGARYVSTDDARVAADVVSVSPEIVGKLLEWRVKEGDMVAKDDVLGRQDLGAALTSAALNPQLMGSVAGVMAEKAVLKAPIAGQVILSTGVVGELAAPGMSLAMIADTDNLYFSANIKEGDISRVRVGQPVDVTVDAYPRQDLPRPRADDRPRNLVDILPPAGAEQRGQLHEGHPGDPHQGEHPGPGETRDSWSA